MTHSQIHAYAIPLAIIFAGATIAGAILWGTAGSVSDDSGAVVSEIGADFRLPSDSDHVRGNPDADIAIIEFSDLECPFCAQLHPTLSRIVEENEDVKWVYRHFPLTSIHANALSAAVASECVAELAGNDAFWTFTDNVFENQQSMGSALYESIASRNGITLAAFRSCLSDDSIAALVSEDNEEAVQSGAQGTPFSVIVTRSGELVPFSGAIPYEDVRRLVDQARAE